MLVPISWLVKSFLMKTNHILFFILFTLNIVWGKPRGGGAPAFWLVMPFVVDLKPTGCTNCSTANLAIRAPTHTLCALHQSTWFFAQPLTPARRVGCMCIVPGAIPNECWAVPAYNAHAVVGSFTCSTQAIVGSSTCSAQAIVGWGAIFSSGWTGSRIATSWGWFLNSHFFTDLTKHFFPARSIASWASHLHSVRYCKWIKPFNVWQMLAWEMLGFG